MPILSRRQWIEIWLPVVAFAWLGFIYYHFYQSIESRWWVPFLALLGVIAIAHTYQRITLSAITCGLRLIFVALVLLGFWTLLRFPADAAVISVILASSITLGRHGLALAGESEMTSFEQAILTLSFGLTFYAYLILALGTAGELQFAPVASLSVALTFVALFRAAAARHRFKITTANLFRRARLWLTPESGVQGLFRVFVLFLAITCLLSNFGPPVSSDDLTYHYVSSQWYALTGRIAFYPYHIHFNLPAAFEMLCTAVLVLKGTYHGFGLLNIVFFGLLAGAFSLLTRRYMNGQISISALLILFSIPFFLIHLSLGAADLKFLLYALLALYALLRSRETRHPFWFIVNAAACGVSMSYRYQGLILSAFCFLVILLSFRHGLRQTWRLLQWCLVALLCGVPFYWKNWQFTGNPFCPTSLSFFNGFLGDPDLSSMWRLYGDPHAFWTFGHYGYGMGLKNLLLAPWQLTFAGHAFEGYMLTPIFMGFLPWIIWEICHNRRASEGFLFCIFYGTAWYFQMHQTKFLIPLLAVLGLIAAAAIDDSPWPANVGWVGKSLWHTFALFPFLVSLSVMYIHHPEYSRWRLPLLFGEAKEVSFLERAVPSYSLVEAMNRNLPANAVVYTPMIGDLFYLKRKYFLGHPFLQKAIDYRQISSPRQFLSLLQSLGVTHALLPSELPSLLHPLHGVTGAAMQLALRELPQNALHTVLADTDWKVCQIVYPRNLPEWPFGPSRDPELIAKLLYNRGSLDTSLTEFRRALALGHTESKNWIATIARMSTRDRADYYYRFFQSTQQDYFLWPALTEYRRTLEETNLTAQDRQVILKRIHLILQAGRQILPRVWDHWWI